MAVGALAEAAVDIVANLDTFEPDLRRKLEGAIRNVSKSVEKDFDKMGARAGKAFSDAAGKVAAASKSFDEVGDAARRMERTTVDAAKGMSDGFKLTLTDVQKLERAVQSASDSQADALGKVRVAEAQLAEARKKSGKESAAAIAAEERLSATQRNAARDAKRLIDVTENLVTARANAFRNAGEVAGEAAGGGFGDGFRRTARNGADDGGRDAGNFFARAFEAAAGRAVGAALLRTFAVGIGSLITAASPLSTVLGGATAAVVALAAALATASGSAISLGGVLGALGLAAATLKVGFSGVGDAMKAQSAAQEELARTGEISTATQEKLDAALKGLAPSAAALVQQLGAMAPAWQAVTQSVQERLFTGVSTAIANLANRYLPILTQQLGTAATTLNQTARSLGAFLSTSTRSSQINSIFTGLNGILRTLLQPLGQLAGAFLNVFQASLPFALQLANVLSSLGTSFAGFLNQAVSSGAFTSFMQTAMTLAGNLFQLLGNIGSIIGSVFAAGTAAGGGLLGILRDLTGQFAQFLKSSAGQSALASFFGLISQAGQILAGVFKTLQPLLAGISSLFRSLQPALQALGAALTPVIAALSTQLGSTFAQLGQVLATLVSTGIGPLAAALGGVLVAAVKALTPILTSLVGGLTALAPGLTAVVQALGTFLVGALTTLGPLLQQLLMTLGQLLGSYLTAIAPVLTVLGNAILQLAAPIAQLVQGFLSIIQVFIPLLPALGQLNAAILQLVLAFLPLVTTILQLFADQVAKMAPILQQAVPFIAQMIAFMLKLAQAVLPVVQAYVAFEVAVIGVLAKIIGAVVSFVGRVIGFFVQLGIGLTTAVTNGTIRMIQIFVNAFKVVRDGVQTFVNNVGQVVGTIVGKITSALSGVAAAFRKPFDAAKAGVKSAIDGIIGVVSDAVGKIQGLVSKISGAIGKLKVPGIGGIDIPGFADGGIIRKPTLATFAERGPEAAIPLTDKGRAMEIMDQSGLTQLALERALGNSAPALSGGGKVREINMPVTVAGLTKEETIQLFREFLQNTFGPKLGLSTAEGGI